MVIYHSRGSLPARHAAAIHMGWLPEAPPVRQDLVAEAWDRMGGAVAMTAGGLWPLGRDQQGRRVFALGRASRPDVVYRAFHGIADIFALDKRSFLLQNVGPSIAWNDLKVNALHSLGLHRRAHQIQLAAVRSGWAEARLAVRIAAERLAVSGHQQA